MNKEILISATDLKKYFPVHKFMGGKQYVKAVDGVSLEINKGETLVWLENQAVENQHWNVP